MHLTALQDLTLEGAAISVDGKPIRGAVTLAPGDEFACSSPKAAMGMLAREQARVSERATVAAPSLASVPADEKREAARQIAEDQRFGTARTDAESADEAKGKTRKR